LSGNKECDAGTSRVADGEGKGGEQIHERLIPANGAGQKSSLWCEQAFTDAAVPRNSGRSLPCRPPMR
jgi:hypothetical protein